MKTSKFTPQISYAIGSNQQETISRQSCKSLGKPIGVVFAIGICLSVITSPVIAETTGGENIQHYMNSNGSEDTAGKVKQNANSSAITKNIEVKTSQEHHVKGAGSATPDAVANSGLKKSSEENCEHDENSTSMDKKSVSGEKQVSASLRNESVTQTPQSMSLAMDSKTNNPNSVDQVAEVKKIEPVSKPTDGKGALPTFAQADVNSDHYITKEELKNFPYLLQVFDKVDAGKDGKLEQHEYQSLKMETKREGEIS